jgi:hypothetical protein
MLLKYNFNKERIMSGVNVANIVKGAGAIVSVGGCIWTGINANGLAGMGIFGGHSQGYLPALIGGCVVGSIPGLLVIGAGGAIEHYHHD